MSSRKPQRRIGLRREASVFLPTATLSLMVLSVVAMLSYRNALVNFTAEARLETLASARTAANLMPPDASTSGALRRAFGRNGNASLLRRDGSVAASIGTIPEPNPLAPLQEAPSEAATAGPDPSTSHQVVAWLPLRNGLILRIGEPRPELAEEWVRWKRLMIVVTSAVGALATLLLLYLRRIFVPIDNLLRTAREFDDAELGEDEDEIEFLLHRFENAMAALRHERQRQSPLVEASGEAPLDEQLETLEQTFSHLESGMALLDLERTVLAVNEVGAATLDLDAGQLPGKLDEVLSDHPSLIELIGSAVTSGTPLRRRECAVSIKGRTRALGLTLSPLSRRDGTRRGWIMLFADLTDAHQQAAREQLSSSLDQLAELSAGLAHELRNSLASMQGYAALLKRAALPSAAAADTAELQREIDQLHRIVEDFLSFARPGNTRLETVDLLRLAHRAASDPALAGAPVKVVLSPDDKPSAPREWTVRGDEQLLHRLLRNLLLNAVRAQADPRTPDETRTLQPVTVRLRQAAVDGEPRLSLRIEDRGPGLSEIAKKRLFVPFSTDSEGGSGLGLAVARRIADLHGAELTVENRDSGGVVATLKFASETTVS